MDARTRSEISVCTAGSTGIWRSRGPARALQRDKMLAIRLQHGSTMLMCGRESELPCHLQLIRSDQVLHTLQRCKVSVLLQRAQPFWLASGGFGGGGSGGGGGGNSGGGGGNDGGGSRGGGGGNSGEMLRLIETRAHLSLFSAAPRLRFMSDSLWHGACVLVW